jgi:hypothetical protein
MGTTTPSFQMQQPAAPRILQHIPPATPQNFHQTLPQMNEPRKVVKENTAIATVPPPKRALDTLHESYRVLGLDDSKPLSHEALKVAYKKSAAKAHPDRGGSSEAFDEVTRAFLYVEEVLNKLIPKGATEGDDARLSVPVTKEAALKARNVALTKYDAEEAAHRGSTAAIQDKPPIALNPKKLNMDLFNQLFEENRMPDPDQDGYGDWLKAGGDEGARGSKSEAALRSKFNSEVFNRAFMNEGVSGGGVGNTAISAYKPPDEIVHSQGVELGGGRPQHYISPMGAKTGYTDLKYAYGEGSTFSQQVANARTEAGRTFNQMKAEREAAPVPLSADESAAVAAVKRQRVAAEEERRRRLAVRDVEAEDVYSKLQRRLMIQ